MFCPNCRTINDNNFRYCYRCGFTLPVVTEEAASDIQPETTPSKVPIPVEESIPVEVSAPVEASVPAEAPVPIEVAVPVEVPAPAQVPIPVPEPVTAPQPPMKKGRLLPPLLLLLAMMIVGLMAYFMNPQPVEDPAPTTDPMPWFTVNNGVLSFDESLYEGESELVVPSKVNGQTVTAIGKGCFEECRELTTVILPETVTEIHKQAFSDCTNLRGIFIPEGVKSIDAAAFHNCLALEAVHLPESLQTLDSRAFSRCRKLVHIFYAGTYEEWSDLYTGVLPTDAWIYCEDGKYPYNQE